MAPSRAQPGQHLQQLYIRKSSGAYICYKWIHNRRRTILCPHTTALSQDSHRQWQRSDEALALKKQKEEIFPPQTPSPFPYCFDRWSSFFLVPVDPTFGPLFRWFSGQRVASRLRPVDSGFTILSSEYCFFSPIFSPMLCVLVRHLDDEATNSTEPNCTTIYSHRSSSLKASYCPQPQC